MTISLAEMLPFFTSSKAAVVKQYILGAGMIAYGESGLGYYIDSNSNASLIVYTNNRTPSGLTAPGVYSNKTAITNPDIWKSIHGTFQHSIGVKTDGTLWVTGSNAFGQVGNGNTTNVPVWTKVGTATNWVKAYAGTEHSVALASDGKIWAWGRNDIAAVIGTGSTSPSNILTPYCVNTTAAPYNQMSAGSTFLDLRGGHRFNMGLDQNRNLWTWGNNGSRQLGRASNSTYTTNPTQDVQILQVDSVGTVSKFSAGAYHAAAITTGGNLYIWGLNGDGQLGSTVGLGAGGNIPRILVPPVANTTWSEIILGEYNSFGILDNGTLWGWGRNTAGQLGVGDTTNRNTPVQIPGSWKFASSGLYGSYGIKTDGTLWAWGSNSNGSLGLPAGTSSSNSPMQIGTLTTWTMAYALQYACIAMHS
jgi:alpha-tubulin suppressor-like RCC1 family protein